MEDSDGAGDEMCGRAACRAGLHSLSFALAMGLVRPLAARSLRHPIADRTPSLQ